MRQLMLFRVPVQVLGTPACPACFPALLAPNRCREIGGGRATRQPGQVRKEAALTRSGSGRSSVSYLFFEEIAPKAASFALNFALGARSLVAFGAYSAGDGSRFADQDCAWELAIETGRKTLNCGSIEDRRWRPSCRARERRPRRYGRRA